MSPCVLCVLPCLAPYGGDEEIRTLDPLLAGQVLSQLSYTPISISTYSVPLWTLKIEQRKALLELHSFFLLRYCEFTVYLLYRFAPVSRSVFSLRQLSLSSERVFLHRKEVIQPHLPIRLPCYDLTPIIEPTLDSCLLAVSSLASGIPDFHGLTGGVYKARERIHRSMLTCDY